MTAVRMLDISKTYGSRFGGPSVRALDRISMEIEAGEFTSVMGPSGSGKTTLLKLLASIERPDSGSILVTGKDLSGLRGDALSDFRRTAVGFVFQDSSLLNSLTIGENIALPLTAVRLPKAEIESRLNAAARSLCLQDILEKFPAEVSSGQKQRAASARAIIAEPAVLLADEPTGALDSRSSRDLMEHIAALNGERGTTVLLTTHDPFVASWARRTIFLRDGRFFTEVRAGGDRRVFFDRIMEVQAAMERRF